MYYMDSTREGQSERQTLAWDGSADGLKNLEDKLKDKSGEHWAFHDAQPPLGCALALPFNPNSAVLSWSCFFITAVHPTSAEVKRRYRMLQHEELAELLEIFVEARSASAALQAAKAFSTTNDRAVSKVQGAWHAASSSVNKALDEAAVDIASPLKQFSSSGFGMRVNCTIIRDAHVAAIDIMGREFVASHFLVTVCVGILATCSAGLTLLFCFLWNIRQEGQQHRFHLVPDDDGPDSEDDVPIDRLPLNGRNSRLEFRTPFQPKW